MTDKLSFTFVELGRFNKRLEDCKDFKEKLYFCLKNMNSLKEAPEELVKDEYFNSLFEYSALNRLTGEELIEYVKAMTTERDKACQIAYAHDKGVEEGIAQGIAKGEAQGIAKAQVQIAKSMLSNGLPVESIAEMTGLTKEQVLAL